MISNMVLPRGLAATEALIRLLQGGFKFDIHGRLRAVADTDQFKVGEDPLIWAEAKGNAPNYFELYWDGVWICDVSEGMNDQQVQRSFWTGFLEAYRAKRVFLSSPEERIARQAEKVEENIEKKIDNLKVDADPKLVKMGKEVLKRVAKDKRKVKK